MKTDIHKKHFHTQSHFEIEVEVNSKMVGLVIICWYCLGHDVQARGIKSCRKFLLTRVKFLFQFDLFRITLAGKLLLQKI